MSKVTEYDMPARPDWPWWVVAWKAFVTVFLIGIWGMLFGWVLLVGLWFGSIPPSLGGGLMIVSMAFLGLAPIWALWAWAQSLWTERDDRVIRGGLWAGILFCGVFITKAFLSGIGYQGDAVAVAIQRELFLPFLFMSLASIAWELRVRQARSKR